VGLTYRYTDRDSSAEAYAYQAHEVIFKLSWQGSLDPFGPWRTAPEKHVALEYGLSREQMLEERVQDLLREEEAAQQSSSCVE